MYSRQVQNAAVKLMLGGMNISELSRRISISPTTLYNWKIQAIRAAENKDKVEEKNTLISKLIEQYVERNLINEEEAKNIMEKITTLIDECLELNPNDICTIDNAIKAAKLRKDYSEAIKFLKKKLRLDTNAEPILCEIEALEKRKKDPTLQSSDEKRRDKTAAFRLSNKLKKTGSKEELELLLRKIISKYPNYLTFQIQLASVLLDKLSENVENVDLITEIESILIPLNEKAPSDLRVKNNLMRLNQILGREEESEVILRKIIVNGVGDYKLKCDLASLLIEKSKTKNIDQNQKDNYLKEAWSLLNKVLSQLSNKKGQTLNNYNVYKVLCQLIEICRLKRDFNTQEDLLRRAIKIKPDNKKMLVFLAGTIIDQLSNALKEKKENKDKLKEEYKSKIVEAKGILQKMFKSNPRDLYVISYLIKIELLQGNLPRAIELLELKISIDPDDIKARERLSKLEEALRMKMNNSSVDSTISTQNGSQLGQTLLKKI
jgi:tetratricopeptide (TPR) repeat protein